MKRERKHTLTANKDKKRERKYRQTESQQRQEAGEKT